MFMLAHLRGCPNTTVVQLRKYATYFDLSKLQRDATLAPLHACLNTALCWANTAVCWANTEVLCEHRRAGMRHRNSTPRCYQNTSIFTVYAFLSPSPLSIFSLSLFNFFFNSLCLSPLPYPFPCLSLFLWFEFELLNRFLCCSQLVSHFTCDGGSGRNVQIL